MRKFLLLILALFLSYSPFAEGTKEFRPLESNKGHLLLYQGYTDFGLFSSGPAEQIKIRVASTSEKVYFGFTNSFWFPNDTGFFVPDVPYRILSPSGVEIILDSMPPPGVQGYINTWSEAVAGPRQLGNAAGYDALQFTPTETGDYVLQFDPTLIVFRLGIRYFDVTVANAAGQPQLGRLHCQGWQFTLENFEIPFNAKIYPYDGGTAVYEVDFNSLAPLVFVVNFNSQGLMSTGDLVEDRKSRIGNYTYPEFEVFLNPPDPNLYPTVSRTLALDGKITRNNCVSFDYCFDFTVNGSGQLEGFIDLNGNGIFDEGFEVAFGEAFSGAGTKCIPWNGRDAAGNVVRSDFQVVASYGFGPMNLPLYDAEDNPNGLKVKLVRPTPGVVPPLFWDDSEITAGTTLGDVKVNLSGCSSSTTGCHKWFDRGSKYDGNQWDQETINTWWYSAVAKKVVLFDNPLKNAVKLSFDAVGMLNRDTTICKGDSLPVYIFNDSEEHFNSIRYQYDWSVNAVPLNSDIRKLPMLITDTSLVVIKATDRQGLVCDSYDTLKINAVDPLKITAIISDPPCNLSEGKITINVLPNPLRPEFFWQEFPLEKTNAIQQLSNGTYHLVLRDSRFSMTCAVDTSFSIKDANGIRIDTVLTSKAYCYDAIGTAEVLMEKPGNYLYSWDAATFIAANKKTGIAAGSYNVTARDPVTGCSNSKPYQILNNKITFSVTSKDETCNDDKGEITIALPAGDFDISWNGITSKVSFKQDLSKGNYNLGVRSSMYPACIFDTLVILNDLVKPIYISQLQTTPADCGIPTGTAEITMPAIAQKYIYTWSNGTIVTPEKVKELPVGIHKVSVIIDGSQCKTDSSFFIPGSGFHYNVYSKDNYCDTKGGKAIVTASSQDVKITWADSPDKSLARYHLGGGNYSFTLVNPNDPYCVASNVIVVNNQSYTLKPDFNYHFTSSKYELDRDVAFENLSDVSNISNWTFGDGSKSKEFNPNHVFKMVKDYDINLHVTDTNGCTGEITKQLKLADTGPCGIALPNAFSPNNDNINDKFGILGQAYSIDLKVFDRWGEVVFRTSDLDERWDGNYREAESMIGIYPYTLDYVCPVEGGLKHFKKVGDISLIR